MLNSPRTRGPRPGHHASPARILAVFLTSSGIFSVVLAACQGIDALQIPGVRLTQFSTAFGGVLVLAIWARTVPFPTVLHGPILVPSLTAAGLGLAVVAVLAVITAHDGIAASPPASRSEAVTSMVVAGYAVGAFAEEVGWRGLVQPLLETRLPPAIAAVVTGLLFGAGHFYLLAQGLLAYAIFIVSAVGFSIIVAAVTSGRGWTARVVCATLLHSVVNVGILVLSARQETASIGWMCALAVAHCLVAAACLPSLARRSDRKSTRLNSSHWE